LVLAICTANYKQPYPKHNSPSTFLLCYIYIFASFLNIFYGTKYFKMTIKNLSTLLRLSVLVLVGHSSLLWATTFHPPALRRENFFQLLLCIRLKRRIMHYFLIFPTDTPQSLAQVILWGYVFYA
jgi:hypothetical protein